MRSVGPGAMQSLLIPKSYLRLESGIKGLIACELFGE